MTSREFIENHLIKMIVKETEKLIKTINDITKIKKIIEDLDENKKLTIPVLTSKVNDCEGEIHFRETAYRRIDSLYEIHRRNLTNKEWALWNEYFEKKKEFAVQVTKFQEFASKYRFFLPNNAQDMQEKVRKLLAKKGYLVDGYFEGNYETWIGVYARLKDKPTYLDAKDGEDADLQNQYRVDGFKQDFSEWFEWEIKNNELVYEV